MQLYTIIEDYTLMKREYDNSIKKYGVYIYQYKCLHKKEILSYWAENYDYSHVKGIGSKSKEQIIESYQGMFKDIYRLYEMVGCKKAYWFDISLKAVFLTVGFIKTRMNGYEINLFYTILFLYNRGTFTSQFKGAINQNLIKLIGNGEYDKLIGTKNKIELINILEEGELFPKKLIEFKNVWRTDFDFKGKPLTIVVVGTKKN